MLWRSAAAPVQFRLSPDGPVRFAGRGRGGAEANVAASLASLGPIKMLTRLPSGPLGDKASAPMAAADVDVPPVGRARPNVPLFPRERRGASALIDHLRSCRQRVRLLPGHAQLHVRSRGSPVIPFVRDHARAWTGRRFARAGSRWCWGLGRRADLFLWQLPRHSSPREILNDLMQSATVMIGTRVTFAAGFSTRGSSTRTL